MKKIALGSLLLFLLSLGFPYGGGAKIFVANENGDSLTIYSQDATGNASPPTVIQGNQATLDHPQQIAVDDNWIYVPNRDHDSIDIFPIDTTGNVAPTRSIHGPTSTVDSPHGVAVDSNYIYVGNYGNHRILVFPKDANGDVAPSRYIQPNSGNVNVIAIDSNWIYVTDFLGHTLSVFPIDVSGTVTPTRKISGSSTTFGEIMGVAVDSNCIYVAQYVLNAVTIFPLDAAGNAFPVRTIQGGNTQLDGPFGIAVQQKIDVWTGSSSLSVKTTFVETDASGNQKFATSNETLAGTMSLYMGETGPTKSAEGCYLKFLGSDGTTICINDISVISTESIKSKNEKGLLIGSGSFVTIVEGGQVAGMSYIDASGTLKEDSSNNVISIGLKGKFGGGVDLQFVFGGNLNVTLTK